MKLRILDYLADVEEYNGVAVSANLKCSCGCDTFAFQYKGKKTKGILAPYIVKLNKQLVLTAACECCFNSFVVYDSSKDGSSPKTYTGEIDFAPFVLPKSAQKFYKAVIKYNYEPQKLRCEDSYSNQFENCFVYVLNSQNKKIALIEE